MSHKLSKAEERFTLAGRLAEIGYRFPPLAAVRLAILACLCLCAGCGSRCEVVPVSGKVTYQGGRWPQCGLIFFSPINSAKGFSLSPAVSQFDLEGNFAVKTGASNGLVPGKYSVAIHCWEVAAEHNHASKSYVPTRYMQPQTSGLELSVPPGSKPIKWNIDVPKS